MNSESKGGGADASNLVPLARFWDRARSVLSALIDELARCGTAHVHEGMSVWAYHHTNASPASRALDAGQVSKASGLHPSVDWTRFATVNPTGEDRQ
jgi:hypothetical protein